MLLLQVSTVSLDRAGMTAQVKQVSADAVLGVKRFANHLLFLFLINEN
jgi:hypothetical protein